MNDYEALLHQAERLEALQEIRNLMGRYSYLHSAFRNKEYAELWAKREDDKLVILALSVGHRREVYDK